MIYISKVNGYQEYMQTYGIFCVYLLHAVIRHVMKGKNLLRETILSDERQFSVMNSLTELFYFSIKIMGIVPGNRNFFICTGKF